MGPFDFNHQNNDRIRQQDQPFSLWLRTTCVIAGATLGSALVIAWAYSRPFVIRPAPEKNLPHIPVAVKPKSPPRISRGDMEKLLYGRTPNQVIDLLGTPRQTSRLFGGISSFDYDGLTYDEVTGRNDSRVYISFGGPGGVVSLVLFF